MMPDRIWVKLRLGFAELGAEWTKRAALSRIEGISTMELAALRHQAKRERRKARLNANDRQEWFYQTVIDAADELLNSRP